MQKIVFKVSIFFQKRWWISKLNSRLSFCYSVLATKKCLKLCLISYIFHDQSYSLVHEFNNPINFCNNELSVVFRILATNSLNISLTILPFIACLQSVLITKAEKIPIELWPDEPPKAFMEFCWEQSLIGILQLSQCFSQKLWAWQVVLIGPFYQQPMPFHVDGNEHQYWWELTFTKPYLPPLAMHPIFGPSFLFLHPRPVGAIALSASWVFTEVIFGL